MTPLAWHLEVPLNQAKLGDATNLTSVHVIRMLRQSREAEVVVVDDRHVEISTGSGFARLPSSIRLIDTLPRAD